MLSEHLGPSHGVEDVHAKVDSVKLTVRGVVSVDLKFVPVFGSISEVCQVLGQHETETRRRLGAGLVKERTHFISKQPGQVKVTIWVKVAKTSKVRFTVAPTDGHKNPLSRQG